MNETKATEIAKRIAKRGEHTLLIGPPGSGATMIARRVVEHLPYPGASKAGADSRAVSQIYRAMGLDAPTQVTTLYRPFRAPHHTISAIALVGRPPDPVTACPIYGELTLAHTGVLFLDEAPEFSRASLERVALALRDRTIEHATQLNRALYPARFLLVAHRHPCPCGYGVGGERVCACTSDSVRRYKHRLDPIAKHLTHVIDLRTE